MWNCAKAETHASHICAIEFTQKSFPGSPRISSPPGPISSAPCFYDHSIKICYHCSTINLLQASFSIVRININLQLGLGDFGVRQKERDFIFWLFCYLWNADMFSKHCSPALWHRLDRSSKSLEALGTFEALLFVPIHLQDSFSQLGGKISKIWSLKCWFCPGRGPGRPNNKPSSQPLLNCQ